MGEWLTKTMLLERVISMAVYVILLFVAYNKIRHARGYDSIRRILNVCIFALCVMAFLYIPSPTADLYRWRSRFAYYGWRDLTFSEFYNSYLLRVISPVSYLYMYLANLTGVEGLLPAFCALVFYGNSFYILKDLIRRHNATSRGISEAFLMFMSAGCFVEAISGVRCLVALSILARCFYDEFLNKKSVMSCLIWEIIASLIHPGAAIIYVGRLFFWVCQRSLQSRKKVFYLLIIFVFSVVFYEFAIKYIKASSHKILDYIINSEDSYSYSWEYILRAIAVIQFISILSVLDVRKLENEFKDLYFFNIVCLVVDLVFAFNYSIFHRFNSMLLLTMIPIVTFAIDKKNKRYSSWVRLLSVIMLLLACTRGNLCGYKFFIL